MKKLLLTIMVLSSAASFAQKKAPKTYDLLIGTYTKGTSKGIQVYRFYTENGRLAYLSQVETNSPSYLCASADNKFVYAVNEHGTDNSVSSFGFDPVNGTLTPINKQPSEGQDPCYISVDKARTHAFVANYSGGSLTVFPINKDGSLAPMVQKIQEQGHGPNTQRQEKSHVHIAMLSPDEKYVLFSDLGADKLNVARYKPSEKEPLTVLNEDAATVMPGNGPRHIEFSPDHKNVYLVTELSGTVYSYSWHNGKLKQLQSVTLLPDGFTGQVGAAAIHVSADGKFVYATNRGTADDIVTFSRDAETGLLTYVDRISTYGKGPRDFTIDPTGNFLLISNQNSDSISIYKRDKETGKLTFTGNRLTIGNPVCLKFVPAE